MSQKTARRDRAQQGAAKLIKAMRRKGWSTNAKVTMSLLTAVVVGLTAISFFTPGRRRWVGRAGPGRQPPAVRKIDTLGSNARHHSWHI